MLFGSSKAHRTLRTILVAEQKLDAIVSTQTNDYNAQTGSPRPIPRWVRPRQE